MGLERYVGTRVILKENIPSDKRGHHLEKGTTLIVTRLVGEQHFDLHWPDGKHAANQIHFSKLKTG